MNEITKALEENGYDHAVAVATKAEVEAGAACGQLAIIAETEDIPTGFGPEYADGFSDEAHEAESC